MTKFAKARKIMSATLKKDEGLRIGYESNIAMLLYDRYGIKDYELRNQAARDLIQLIFHQTS